MKNPYTIMGVEVSASQIEIRLAYRKLAQALHPDREGGDQEAFTLLQWAYTILKDEVKRQQYDMHGKTDFTGPSKEDKALSEIMNAFNQWVEAVMQGRMPTSSDCIKNLKSAFDQEIKKVTRNRSQVELHADKLNKLVGRFEHDGSKDNVFSTHLQNLIDNSQKTRENLNERLEVLVESLLQLDHFTYTPEEGLIANPTITTYYTTGT